MLPPAKKIPDAARDREGRNLGLHRRAYTHSSAPFLYSQT